MSSRTPTRFSQDARARTHGPWHGLMCEVPHDTRRPVPPAKFLPDARARTHGRVLRAKPLVIHAVTRVVTSTNVTWTFTLRKDFAVKATKMLRKV